MTASGLRTRWLNARARLCVAWNGLPHGCDVQVDIDRRLTRTPVRLIFDVGANRGQSAQRLRRWYPGATMHCFEPVASTFALLNRAVGHWPNVHTHHCALGAEAAHGSVVAHVNDDQSRILAAGGSGEQVEVQTIDAVCGRLGISAIDYLKIDTEGHDLFVLKGAERLLGDAAVSIIETEAGMNPENAVHVGARELTDLLEGWGYRLFGVYEQTLEWPSADAYLRRTNLVFVSPEAIRRNRFPAT